MKGAVVILFLLNKVVHIMRANRTQEDSLVNN